MSEKLHSNHQTEKNRVIFKTGLHKAINKGGIPFLVKKHLIAPIMNT